VRVSVHAGLTKKVPQLENIVGLVRGTDPHALAGVRRAGRALRPHRRGRLGPHRLRRGRQRQRLDRLVELAEAFALCRPKRSILLPGSAPRRTASSAAWSSARAARGQGLDGGHAQHGHDRVRARRRGGGARLPREPGFEDVLKEAKKLRATQLKKVWTDKGYDLWERSDHYSFHKIGIPVLFFLESGKDSTTPTTTPTRDTLDGVSIPKSRARRAAWPSTRHG
jgi:hypothetical protein